MVEKDDQSKKKAAEKAPPHPKYQPNGTAKGKWWRLAYIIGKYFREDEDDS